jgi:signal transduction histidine kinase
MGDRVRFRTQVIVGVGALLVLTLFGGVMTVFTLAVTTSRSNELTKQVVEDLSDIDDVRVRAEEVVSAARGYLLVGNKAFRDKLETRQREMERALSRLRGQHPDPGLQGQLAIVEKLLHDYLAATTQVAYKRSETSDLETLEDAFERSVQPHRAALYQAVSGLAELERARVRAEMRESRTVIRRFGIALLVAWLIGTAIGMGLAVRVLKRVHAQYQRVQAAEQRANEAADARKQIVDIVAHDLLSPLNTIVLGLEVMKESSAIPGADAIGRAAGRMQRLVNDLLEVSQAKHLGFSLEREHHCVVDLLAATREAFHDAAQRARVRLRVAGPPDLHVFADRDRVLRVLANLVGNAVRIAREGDEIVLTAQPRDHGVRISVVDSGPGIPRSEVEHLFEAYRQGTGRRRRGSLGLGLFISKLLVEAHGGRIGVDTTPGTGSTFWFDIPSAVTAGAVARAGAKVLES